MKRAMTVYFQEEQWHWLGKQARRWRRMGRRHTTRSQIVTWLMYYGKEGYERITLREEREVFHTPPPIPKRSVKPKPKLRVVKPDEDIEAETFY